ncbi:MAG: Lrp/AsnC family transcriptional regulator [Gammaproteobacteria bacterium]|nr:Lrp/AsnC family transcriptional regulator [Gammaproteobacteria bacterium]
MAHDGINYTSVDENSSVEQHLLNDFQHNFPLSPTPYADMGKQLGISEEQVLQILQAKKAAGVISRVGAVFAPNKVGASTLAAMAVSETELEQVAEQVSSFDSINHNYQREHEYNLWFVITAASKEILAEEIKKIESRTGYEILNLPMLEDYHIDLGFDIKWT